MSIKDPLGFKKNYQLQFVGTIQEAKLPLEKWFGNKTYQLWETYPDKASAKRDAASYRKNRGWNARIVKTRGGFYKWAIYVSRTGR